MRKSIEALGLLVIAMGIPFAGAAAQDQGACRAIRKACLDAGFIQGGAREGVGLHVHCVMPIMQARAQPPTARKPLPVVNPQMAATCAAENPGFGRPRLRQALTQPSPQQQPAGSPSSAPVPAPTGAQQAAAASALPPEERPETGPVKPLPPQFRRTTIEYRTNEPAGTIIIDTSHTYLYLVLGRGKALRYGVGVGREGFTWNGAEKITRMAQWPDWHPPEEMIERQPYLPRFMAGGEGNPLGARALYLGQTLYRIHGTNQPSTIGTFVSSGCVRLTNEDITDLYSRVKVGTRVVVLPGTAPPAAQAASAAPAEPPRLPERAQ